ncbi:TetR/AcrR family transcriptional regulator [Arachidicoccus soli]|uniref:TetR/AcrR family transcriptional regulator n=1 Tax=Arachidicoccus soli TaxID=2341117 RepID=UPI0013C4C124|nr:TetR/AcrR family transcriptional regulator [Arachidicoccus soli]
MKQIQLDDRRTQKTKKNLADALKELILEKGYDAVTVQEIIDRANVGRSTFYNHYESKEQLLVGNINFQEALINVPVNDDENYPMGINIAYLFNHLKEHVHSGKAMMGSRGIDFLFNYFADLCAMRILEYHKRQPVNTGSGQQMIRYQAEAAAGGITRMLFKWLEDGAVVPVNEMIALAKRILELH